MVVTATTLATVRQACPLLHLIHQGDQLHHQYLQGECPYHLHLHIQSHHQHLQEEISLNYNGKGMKARVYI